MMKKELHGTAKYLQKIYTVEGGPEKHDNVQQTKGMLKLTMLLLTGLGVKSLISKIEDLELKIHKPKGD